MDQKERTKRFGLCLILCACVLRLFLVGDAVAAWLTDPQVLPFLIYLETGRDVRFSASIETFSDHAWESPPPWLPPAEEPPAFSPEDAAEVAVDYLCDLRPDLEELMASPLPWKEKPAVLIVHTHATESYCKNGEDYVESARYRTLDEGYNMLSIGDAVEEILREQGITVIHDRQLHDYPSYNGSYVHARASTEEILKENPEIGLILDIHRDASASGGKQLRTETLVAGEVSAQLMLVVGTNVSRQSHKNWEENLALALKLHALLERRSPGIMRPLQLRSQRFNQDLSPGALIVEVGAAGNTHAEALTAARVLAESVAELVMR